MNLYRVTALAAGITSIMLVCATTALAWRTVDGSLNDGSSAVASAFGSADLSCNDNLKVASKNRRFFQTICHDS